MKLGQSVSLISYRGAAQRHLSVLFIYLFNQQMYLFILGKYFNLFV